MTRNLYLSTICGLTIVVVAFACKVRLAESTLQASTGTIHVVICGRDTGTYDKNNIAKQLNEKVKDLNVQIAEFRAGTVSAPVFEPGTDYGARICVTASK